MKVHVNGVGNKMPAWVESGVVEYQKRLPRNFELVIKEIPLGRRGKANNDLDRIRDNEGKSILNAVPANSYVIALDVQGKALSTEAMAGKLRRIMDDGRSSLALLVGGPDGLSPECLEKADEIWSLSALTLPHTVVRIVVAEQVYRIWSVLAGHPYHRE